MKVNVRFDGEGEAARDRDVELFECMYALFPLGALIAGNRRERTHREAAAEADVLDALEAISEPHEDKSATVPVPAQPGQPAEPMRTLKPGAQTLVLTSASAEILIKYLEAAMPAVAPRLTRSALMAARRVQAAVNGKTEESEETR